MKVTDLQVVAKLKISITDEGDKKLTIHRQNERGKLKITDENAQNCGPHAYTKMKAQPFEQTRR